MTAKSKSETFEVPDGGSGGWTYTAYTYHRDWNTQRRPYRAPLGFIFSAIRNNVHLDYSPEGGHGMVLPDRFWWSQHADNHCYERVTNAIGDQSSWGENLAEAHQAVGLVTHAASTLTSAAKQLHQGNIFGAAKTLGLGELSNGTQKRLRNAKSFGNRWLELHFGVQPLMQDIHSSLQTLSKADFGTRRIQGQAHDTDRDYWRTDQYDGAGVIKQTTIQHYTRTYNVKQSMRVRISNPNAYLANQFGVVNPLTVAWNLTPYSFVVDWFSNVSQCLNAMTDFVGLNIESAYFTTFSRNTLDHADYWRPDQGNTFVYSNTGLSCVRAPGHFGPSLEVKPFKGFSVTRGATAIALLLQHL